MLQFKTKFIVQYSGQAYHKTSRFYGLLNRAVQGLGLKMADLVVGVVPIEGTKRTRKAYDSIRARAIMTVYSNSYVADERNHPNDRAAAVKQYRWALEELERLSF